MVLGLLEICRSSYIFSTADLLTVISHRTTRAFNRSGVTRPVALDMSKAFERVWHAGLFHKVKSYGISGPVSSFLSNV